MTYTFAILDLSPAAYWEIRQKLRAAGYDHAIDDADGGTIDMHGLAVKSTPADPRLHAGIAALKACVAETESYARDLMRAANVLSKQHGGEEIYEVPE
jgi:hypothetical protein